jgi:polyisoprenoid-binding protein YceI
MNRRAILCISLIISTLNFYFGANAQNWKPVTAAVTFKIKHSLGATAEGSFKGFAGSINFEPTNLSNASIKATIDVKTINTGINLRDNAMRSDDYFDVEKYPRISMVSTKIEKTTKENEYFGYFNLTIKNVTKNIKIPFIFAQTNNKGTFTGSFSINRTEYGVGDKSALLGNTATIYITINTQQ